MNTLELFKYLGLDDLFTTLAALGMILAGVSIVTTVNRGNWIVHNLYQLSYMSLAFALGWCAIYGVMQNWAPWPPMIAVLGAIDFLMMARLASHHLLMGATLPRYPFNRPAAGAR